MCVAKDLLFAFLLTAPSASPRLPGRIFALSTLRPSTVNSPSLSPFLATLTDELQPTENSATLSPSLPLLRAASCISPLFASLAKDTGGGVPAVISFTPRPYSFLRATSNPPIQRIASVFSPVRLSTVDFQPSAVGIDLAGHSLCHTWRWTPTPITGTLLVTRRVSRRGNPPSPAVRACSSRGPTVSVSLTNQKRKASKHV